MGLRIAVDIGGTFTDFCLLDETTGVMRVAKTASSKDPIDGLFAGLAQENVDLSDVTLFSHGTTVATNALITRRLPRAAMVCTEGFRDVIEIRRANKEDLWDTYKDVARPYIPRRDRLTVTERVDAEGRVVVPLDEAGARNVARILRKRSVAAVAVCFMNAFMNGANERRMKAILEEELPGIPITASADVLPEIFEHERFSTTVVNAVLAPVVGQYTARLGDRLAEGGYRSDLLLLHSGGGVMTAKGATNFAARLAGSGIAAGAIASRHIAMQCGYANSIGLDMGGTSCDVSLAWEGRSRVTKDWFIEFGYPIRFPSIEVPDDRRGRRVTCLDRRRRVAAQWAAIGRGRSGARVLWPRQFGANQHRCACGARSACAWTGGWQRAARSGVGGSGGPARCRGRAGDGVA